MTKDKKHVPKKNKASLINTAKLIIVIIAAFVAALLFRRSAGIIAMFPLAFIICGFTAFIGISSKLKLVIYGITVFTVNTVEQSDISVTLIFTALCLLFCLVAELSVKLLRGKKKAGLAVLSAGVVIGIGLSVAFVGNPITAISANSVLNSYTDAKYPNAENAVLGEFEFSEIYYNFRTETYEIEALSSKYPTEAAVISADGERLNDGLERIMKEKLSEPYVLEITALLREYFPTDSFAVIYDDIAAMPNESILSAKEGELYGRIAFEVTLGGVQTANAMLEKVDRYMQVIDDSGIGYSKIIFKSGVNPWVRRSVTVDQNRPVGFGEYLIEHVHAGTSNRFNRYVSNLIAIP